jgi:Glycosyl transferase family 2
MVNLIGTMLARNEDWIIGLSARAALMWVDELVIFDHASTDGTEKIFDELRSVYGKRVWLLQSDDPIWHEAQFRQRCLDFSRLHGATHIAIIDADEVLTGNLVSTHESNIELSNIPIRRIIESMPARSVFQPKWKNLRHAINEVHISGTWARANVSLAFKDDAAYGWQARGTDGYEFHHRHPMGATCDNWMPAYRITGGLMHLQMVSDRRLRSKQALYKITERLRWPDRHSVDKLNEMYNLAVYGDPGQKMHMGVTPAEWWAPYKDLMRHMHIYAAPWQEAEVRRLLKVHGPEPFAGLDLFGVDK